MLSIIQIAPRRALQVLPPFVRENPGIGLAWIVMAMGLLANKSARSPGGQDGNPMKKKRRYLTATLPDGHIKTIGPTTDAFTHYWRIVAELENGKTEVFWGHTRSLAEARRKSEPAREAARVRGWKSFAFDIAELVETPA